MAGAKRLCSSCQRTVRAHARAHALARAGTQHHAPPPTPQAHGPEGLRDRESPYLSVDPTPPYPVDKPLAELRRILLDPEQRFFDVSPRDD